MGNNKKMRKQKSSNTVYRAKSNKFVEFWCIKYPVWFKEHFLVCFVILAFLFISGLFIISGDFYKFIQYLLEHWADLIVVA